VIKTRGICKQPANMKNISIIWRIGRASPDGYQAHCAQQDEQAPHHHALEEYLRHRASLLRAPLSSAANGWRATADGIALIRLDVA